MARPRKPPRFDRRDDNGVWEVIYYCDKAGRTVRRSLGTDDEAKAREEFSRWLVLRQPEGVDVTTLTVGDVLTFYDAHAEKNLLGYRTIKGNIKRLRSFFGSIPAKEISAKHTKAYIDLRVNVNGLKPGSCRNELDTLKAAYSHASKEGFGDLAFVPIFAMPEPSPPKEDFLNEDEMRTLLDYLEANRKDGKISKLEAFIVLAFRTAARKTAILELTWDRVFWKRGDRGVIDFQTPQWKALPLKRRSKRRTIVPMSEKLRAFMEEYYAQAAPEPTDRVIGFTSSPLYKAMDRLIKKAGLPVRPHLLRRSFGSIASMRGTPTKQISQIMGNTERIAETRYLRFNPEYLKNAVEID